MSARELKFGRRKGIFGVGGPLEGEGFFGSEGSFRSSSLRSDWRQNSIFADLSHSTQWRFASWFVKTAVADAAKSAL